MNWIKGLETWRRDRNILTPSGQYVDMIEEELEEYQIAMRENDRCGVIDAIADIIVLSVNECELEGYDINLVMKEVVAEISSRQQCPEQAERDWMSTEKWQKDRNQDKDSLYKADLYLCKK